MNKSLFWQITDQILHFLMGFVVALPVAYYSHPLSGVIVSRIVWTIREVIQHKRMIWWNLDLFFIDLGILSALVAWFLIK